VNELTYRCVHDAGWADLWGGMLYHVAPILIVAAVLYLGYFIWKTLR
jgi:hypothetical protein